VQNLAPFVRLGVSRFSISIQLYLQNPNLKKLTKDPIFDDSKKEISKFFELTKI